MKVLKNCYTNSMLCDHMTWDNCAETVTVLNGGFWAQVDQDPVFILTNNTSKTLVMIFV